MGQFAGGLGSMTGAHPTGGVEVV